MTNSQQQFSDPEEYETVSVVRLTMDDPTNENMEEGDVMIAAGSCPHGNAYSVLHEAGEDFVDIECEVLEQFEPEKPMMKSDIIDWGVQQAKKSERDY